MSLGTFEQINGTARMAGQFLGAALVVSTTASGNVGQADMSVTGVIDQMPEPQGTGPGGAPALVTFSLLYRCTDDPAATPTNCYAFAYGYDATGAVFVQWGKWVAGVFTPIGANVPITGHVPQPSDTWQASVTGSAHVGFLNGAQVSTLSDATFAAGTYWGLSEFRNTLTSDARCRTAVAVPITTPTGGGGGTRDARLWPWPATEWPNRSIGTGAIYDSRDLIPGGANVNSVAFGLSISGAGYATVNEVDTSENHRAEILADGVTCRGHTTFLDNNGTYTQVNLKTSAAYNVFAVNGNQGLYERATKLPGMAGPIRLWEAQAAAAGDVAAIRHCIGLGMSSHILANSIVWPAFAKDSFAGTNTGFLPYSSLAGIPPGSVMPTGLNNYLKALWTALRNFGARSVDATGPFGGSTDTLTIVESEAAAKAFMDANCPNGNAGLMAILHQLRWITNSDQTNIGGPGTRLDTRAVPTFA